MPTVDFTLRWADDTEQRCQSPSTAIEPYLAEGASYPHEELLRRTRDGLTAASDRVVEVYGMACTAAAAQLEAIERAARPGLVTVTRLRRAPTRIRFPAPERLSGHYEVVIVGGGQAGLAVSHCLLERGVRHVVLERDRVLHNWRDARWDAFSLVTPNWQCALPGHPYAGDDPDGFMVKDEILAYVEPYAQGKPVYEGVTVHAVRPGFEVETSHGTLTADQVVLAVGGYHVPRAPDLGLPGIHSAAYRNPHALPDGPVLVVGTGQSGAQIAEDLHLAGREVHLAVGTAPRVARFYRGRDCVAWLQDMGHYDMPVTEHPQGKGARHEANHYVTGRGGGHDLDLRAFARERMHLHGRLTHVEDGTLHFAGDLQQNLDAADATMERIKDAIDRHIAANAIDAPTEPRYTPVWRPLTDGSGTLEATEISTIVWATGFTPSWSFVHLPEAFDADGHPEHLRGVTAVDGLYFIGLPWLHTWGSGRFAGIARDAEHLAEAIGARAARPQAA
ncbi:MSMEG_0569 family flavin-dependent oxidoreductase [Solirubrobacter phytolaccae]|uniref:MSMEG_0569 family flavin-dependent oxidoreductase n=1 Tax=Solirubrobacter phytolaccae TaxID=1404360 RepID=A0A9X3N9N0_9ACTN|nr:MSMEG_0569 family flavin-dependent oxidoreductase [Solirubrobacter phytolaccae]MDA0182530.1 MSMEG_0569 family flavin-dependent oxidoreductase [Solirubrobacter phytolaccae]